MDHPEACQGIQAVLILYIVQLLCEAVDLLEHAGVA